MMIPRTRIRAIRQAMNLGVAQFARHIGVTRQTISNWEAGRTEPPLPVVHLLTMIGEREGV